ncbi:MAG TPA: thiamine pyrophosphate-binding protein [Burkholderiales bacterium]|nr:thiamine pyrophosphate-binding protein [Burkholderiales bacterium]
MPAIRGADIVAQSLARAGVRHLFSLSGNHIMPLYDAALDAKLAITHTRHEGAAVHMADAWARLTAGPGVALFTGGPGHANGIGALYTALASESPVVMLSGHAPLSELGKGSFQELRQADMAEPVVKASWTAQSAAALGDDIARAMRIATSGRPGPVHVSLPFDLLEEKTDAAALPSPEAFRAPPLPLDVAAADAVLDMIAGAQRPLILTGAVMSGGRAGGLRERLAEASGVPVLCMESPRGLNDPAQGALAGVVGRADLIVLLGKQPDFTLRFGQAPAIAATCRIAVIDPDGDALQRAVTAMGPQRVAIAAGADTLPAAQRLVERAAGRRGKASGWMSEVEAALRVRPPVWAGHAPRAEGPVHPIDVGRAVQSLIDSSPDAVFVSDGGEFGQWAQACVRAPARLINGQGGSIGSAIPFALAARMARPGATVVAATGDGACGYHLLELETAVRAGLPVVIVVGNDACWNAEHQIQLRTYGKARAHACELLPTRYDQAAAALGAHGERVTRAADLAAALSRAASSGKPALVNVMIERLPAPTVRAQ